jgi:hypothetical protein
MRRDERLAQPWNISTRIILSNFPIHLRPYSDRIGHADLRIRLGGDGTVQHLLLDHPSSRPSGIHLRYDPTYHTKVLPSGALVILRLSQ